MKKKLKKITKFIRTNKIQLLAAVAAVVVVSIPGYAHQNRQAELQKQEQEKLALIAEKEAAEAEVQALKEKADADKKAAQKAAEEEKKRLAAEAAAQQQTTEYVAPKPMPKPKPNNDKKKEYKKTSVSLLRSGGNVVATMVNKPGVCDFKFYNTETKDHDFKKGVSAGNGNCSTTIPGGFNKAIVHYRASDNSVKGNSDWIYL